MRLRHPEVWMISCYGPSKNSVAIWDCLCERRNRQKSLLAFEIFISIAADGSFKIGRQAYVNKKCKLSMLNIRNGKERYRVQRAAHVTADEHWSLRLQHDSVLREQRDGKVRRSVSLFDWLDYRLWIKVTFQAISVQTTLLPWTFLCTDIHFQPPALFWP